MPYDDTENNNQNQSQGEVIHKLKKIRICAEHTPTGWVKGEYFDNKDGTVSCKFCCWGARLPGYMRCIEGKIVDLRSMSRS